MVLLPARLNQGLDSTIDWKSDGAVVIPCLNEAGTISGIVSAARRFIELVVVVDDGSEDQTGDCAREAGAVVVRQDRTSGKGAALKAGWSFAMARQKKWCFCLDGDGQHDPFEMPQFMAKAVATGAELIIGDRMSTPSGMPWFRWLVNRWMSRRISILAGVPMPDTQCGFRLLNLRSLSRLIITHDHYEIESDVLVEFLRHGHGVEFVPIRVIYDGQNSRIRPLRDTIRWFQWYGRVRAGFDIGWCPERWRARQGEREDSGSSTPGSIPASTR